MQRSKPRYILEADLSGFSVTLNMSVIEDTQGRQQGFYLKTLEEYNCYQLQQGRLQWEQPRLLS